MSATTLVGVPDSPLIEQARSLLHDTSEPYLVNHAMRSWLFAAVLAKADETSSPDPELLGVAVLLHDLGLTTKYTSSGDRFEVDGANAARDFLQSHRIGPADVQLVWDAIALHTTRSIALHKEPLVALCHSGVQVDISGLRHEDIAPTIMEQILHDHPRLALKARLSECLCAIVARKPATTYDNFMRDFGERYVAGYRPPSSVDRLIAAPFED